MVKNNETFKKAIGTDFPQHQQFILHLPTGDISGTPAV